MKKEFLIIGVTVMVTFAIVFAVSCKKESEEANSAPTCSIVSPNSGDEFNKGDTVVISVDANDADGNVTEVRLYIDGIGKEATSTFPYQFIWNTVDETIGNHYIKVTAIDDDGGSSSDEVDLNLIVGGSSPTAAFIADAITGSAPLVVLFTDKSTDTPTTWYWTFGDGGTSTEQNPSHTYSVAGVFTVTLDVSNEYGSDSEIKADYIIVDNGGATGEPCPGIPIVTDIDGNAYNTIQIGSQCWMKENLKTTSYRNGTAIPYVTDNDEWHDLMTGAYTWYENDISWKDQYGALYNWFATVDTSGLCPAGWHVPSNSDWEMFTDFIGGSGAPSGNILKSCRQVNSPQGSDCNTTEHPRWDESGQHGLDNFGFSGLPGGTRGYSGSFINMGSNAYWWSTSLNGSIAWTRDLDNNSGNIGVLSHTKQIGFSVRCIKD